MTIKKIVRKPTPETSPFLYYGDDNKIIESLIYNKERKPIIIDFMGRTPEQYKYNKSFYPVSFQDIKTIKNLNNKYGSKRPSLSWKGKIVYFLGSNEIVEILVFLLIATVIALTEIFTAIKVFKYISQYINSTLLSSILTVIGIALLIVTVVISCFLTMEKFCTTIDNPYQSKYLKLINKNDKKLLKNKIFLHIPTYKERKNHEKIIGKINTILNKNTDNIDLYELKTIYNEYMQLLSFMLTNKNNISHELYNNYRQQLKNLTQNIIKETDNITILIKEQEEYMDKNKKELNNLNQEIIDNEAMTIFPMK